VVEEVRHRGLSVLLVHPWSPDSDGVGDRRVPEAPHLAALFLSCASHSRLLVSAAKHILAGGVAFGLGLLRNAPSA